MPVFTDPDTGLPGFSYNLPPEDPANPDQVPVADFSTPPRAPEEVEHEGVIALGGHDIPDPDKPQPAPEEPEGDPDDNDQPSGNPEDDDDDDDYSDPDDDDPGNDQHPAGAPV